MTGSFKKKDLTVRFLTRVFGADGNKGIPII